MQLESIMTSYQTIMVSKSKDDWQLAYKEKPSGFTGYSGKSKRNQWHLAQKSREKAANDALLRETYVTLLILNFKIYLSNLLTELA